MKQSCDNDGQENIATVATWANHSGLNICNMFKYWHQRIWFVEAAADA